jgi:two-component system, OmpR family, response regulator CpxR
VVIPKLLVIDDDAELSRLLFELLTKEGFLVEVLGEGRGAADVALNGGYRLVILDVMLPGLGGFEILRQIRRRSTIPVIVLTAHGDEANRVTGLESGADDYVRKPFNARELVARIRAVLRRTEASAAPMDVIRIDDVVLDSAARSVRRSGLAMELTTVEFDVLRELMSAAGRTVSRERLAETVLGRRFDPCDRSVDMHISKLRRKLGPRLGGGDRIKTIRGLGYQYTPAPGDEPESFRRLDPDRHATRRFDRRVG